MSVSTSAAVTAVCLSLTIHPGAALGQIYYSTPAKAAIVLDSNNAYRLTGSLPHLVPFYDGKGYILVGDYTIDVLGTEVTINKGFLFDGASLPAVTWMTFNTPFDPELMIGALVHDFCYWTGILPRDKADELFKSCLLACGVGDLKASLYYRAVRAAGWRRYAKKAIDDKSQWIIKGDEIVPL